MIRKVDRGLRPVGPPPSNLPPGAGANAPSMNQAPPKTAPMPPSNPYEAPTRAPAQANTGVMQMSFEETKNIPNTAKTISSEPVNVY